MSRSHLPPASSRWRALLGEIGTIVLGVFIALAAGQAVQSWNERGQMRELRVAVNNEVAQGIGIWHDRFVQDRCVQARLDELTLWLRGWRAGQPQRLTGPIAAPLSGPSGTSVWEGRDPVVMTQMPLPAKLAYGSIYDEFANNEVQRLDERMTWLALSEFDEAETLDNASMMRLQGLITRARWRAANISSNYLRVERIAHNMGIKPEPDPFPAELLAPLCTSVLPAN